MADSEPAEQGLGRLVEKKKRHGLAGSEFLLVADDAAAKGAFGHFVGAPGRLPRLEKAAALASKLVPLTIVGVAGETEQIILIGDLDRLGLPRQEPKNRSCHMCLRDLPVERAEDP
ncbi:hypothetical protein D3C78_1606160 [compost metagenome]